MTMGVGNVANNAVVLDAPGYETLAVVLGRAFEQAARGKGAVRHGQGQPFDEQPMQQLIALYGVGFALGQSAKKAQESQRLPHDAAVRELLGAINYLAGAVIAMELQQMAAENAAGIPANDNGHQFSVDGRHHNG